MKKLLLILLCLPLLFSSCTNHYKDGEFLFNKGVNEESQDYLNGANLKLDMIEETNKYYKKSRVLKHKIDSVIFRWDSIYQAKEVADSLWYLSYKEKLEKDSIFAEKNKVNVKEKKKKKRKSVYQNKRRYSPNWYEGGTLHKSSVSNWRNASYDNKLATCGDWMATVNNKVSMEELKDRAEKLLICINEAVAMDEYGQEISGNLQSAFIATGCITLLRY